MQAPDLTPATFPTTMRAVELSSYDGQPISLRLIEKPLPTLGPEDVLVKMTAAPINPSDMLFIAGRYGIRKPLPVVPGLEGSGVVVAIGGWRGKLLLGRRVACGGPEDSDGTWASHMKTRIDRCLPLSKHVGTVQGATMIVNPMTVWGMVERVRQGKHKAFIQTAAASSLGQMIVRLAQKFKLPLINIVRRPEQVTLLEKLGAEYVLNSNDEHFTVRLARLCCELQATCALDAVGGDLTRQILDVMPRSSTVIVYGLLSGEPASASVRALVFEDKSLTGFWLSDWFREKNAIELLSTSRRVQQMLAQELRTGVRAAFPLERVADALQLYADDMSGGKILLMPGLGSGGY